MSAYKILIADKMDKQAEEIFNRNNLQADVKPGLSEAELISIIDQYDGVAARSSAKITAPIIAAAKKLKVIGRAGIGVDTIDVKAATAAGIVVMNTPFGNSITTAEHTIAMMMALARQIPEANASTHSGKWEKSKFMGVELYGKVLGIIGCGNIGAIVASRALGLQMRVLAFDPYLTEDRARELGVSKVELDELYERSDFITIHTPKTDQTSGMINKLAFSKMKKGVRLINCARGGLIV
jgi:D-3-phosphoglycerate dehydrogenase